MHALLHARISAGRWGGRPQDYLAIHDLIDSTKELASDGRHRILHTIWGVRRVVVPIFGHTIENSEGKQVSVQDLCERDHILPDYDHRFIPTLGDFVEAMGEELPPDFQAQIETLHQELALTSEVSELMLSPLTSTGQLRSLLLTHNSWFINAILPKIFGTKPVIRDFGIAPSAIFFAMRFESWMDNGLTIPKSARNLARLHVSPPWEKAP